MKKKQLYELKNLLVDLWCVSTENYIDLSSYKLVEGESIFHNEKYEQIEIKEFSSAYSRTKNSVTGIVRF